MINMPASKKISSKLTGGRRGTPIRGRQANEIDPNNIGSITLNRDAIQALTLAQAKVQVTIAAGGTTAILVSEETGKQIGGLDDLAKLLGLRSFVSKEKKMSASSDMQQGIITAAFRAQEYLKEHVPGFQQKKLDNSFILAAKPYKAMADALEVRIDSIRENYHENSKPFQDQLRFYCTEMFDAIGLTMAAMVAGEKEKGKLDALLFEKGVPAFVKNKLLMKSLVIAKDTDLSRVFFPQDPSKGFALSVKEWRSIDFLKKQGYMTRNSNFLINILQNDEIVLELTGLTAEQWANEEDPRVQRVLKTRILAVPPFEDFDRVLEPLSRPNFRGFGLPATAMDQSRDRLANLCAVPIRAYAFSVRMAETIPDFFDRVLPAGTIRAPDDKLGNYAKQTMAALEAGATLKLMDIISMRADSIVMLHWIERECKLIPRGDLSKKIAKAAGLQSAPVAHAIASPIAPRVVGAKVKLLDLVTTGAERDKYKSFRSEAFSIKEKVITKKRQPAASVLCKEAKGFLKEVAKEHSPLLAQAMESYFRGFYSEAIQTSAVRIAVARFDELDELSELDEDSSDDGESDEDDQE